MFNITGHTTLSVSSLISKVAGLFKVFGQKDARAIPPAPSAPPQRRDFPPPHDQHAQRRRTNVQAGRERTRKDHRRPSPPAGGRAPYARVPHAIPTPPVAPSVRWDPLLFTVPPEEGKLRFHDFNLPEPVMHAIADLGFRYCTPIQSGILAKTLQGRDATGRAQTGTGKTAAFLITILSHILKNPLPEGRKAGTPRALILAPTRELVLQIDKDARAFTRYTHVRSMAVFGGMDYVRQRSSLVESPIDIVAATPGRLLDYKRKGDINLSKVEILVIDEADRMLDMGFIPDVRRIIESTPMKGKRQTMFFSATLTPEVQRLAVAWTRDPVHVDVTPPTEVTLSNIDQMVYITTNDEKFTLLYNLITLNKLDRIMIFGNRRDETQRLKERLAAHGIRCGLLSGDVSQEQRLKTLEAFRRGALNALVATDVAARGLHIEGVSHVINYSLPLDPEDYVHRIGRTGRAGASGISVSFATETEAYEIPEIEQYIGRELRAIQPEPALLVPLRPVTAPPAVERGRGHEGRLPSRHGTPHHGRRPGRHGPRGGRPGGHTH